MPVRRHIIKTSSLGTKVWKWFISKWK